MLTEFTVAHIEGKCPNTQELQHFNLWGQVPSYFLYFHRALINYRNPFTRPTLFLLLMLIRQVLFSLVLHKRLSMTCNLRALVENKTTCAPHNLSCYILFHKVSTGENSKQPEKNECDPRSSGEGQLGLTWKWVGVIDRKIGSIYLVYRGAILHRNWYTHRHASEAAVVLSIMCCKNYTAINNANIILCVFLDDFINN